MKNCLLKDTSEEPGTWLPRLYISDSDSIHAIRIQDIYYLVAEGSYTQIVTTDKTYLSSRPLKSFDQALAQLPFFRSHHSYIVNLTYMSRYDKACRYIQLVDGSKVQVSHRKRDQLLSILSRA